MERATSATVVSRCLEVVARTVDPLTGGQRWTASLMAGLAVVVLAFGMPARSGVVGPSVREAAPVASGGRTGDTVAPPEVAPAPGGGNGTGSSGAGRTVRGPGPVPDAPIAAEEPAGPAPAAGDPQPSVVALVDPEAPDDRAMAEQFLGDAGLAVQVVPREDPASTCGAVPAGSLVVSAHGLPPELRSCVESGGGRTLSWDDAPDPGGPSLSTRRGAARSLLDAAGTVEPAGVTALVGDERLRPALEPVVAAAGAAGLRIDVERWLGDDGDAATAALDLAADGVGTVVFATTVDRQSVIASQLRIFAPALQVVVLDAADAVVDGAYPPTLEGARAVTSVRHPWHPAPSELRSSCLDRWAADDEPDPAADGDAELRALLWCQHADLARALLDGEDVASGERQSSVTTALGPLPDGGFGPTVATVATWAADCGCWEQPAVRAAGRGGSGRRV